VVVGRLGAGGERWRCARTTGDGGGYLPSVKIGRHRRFVREDILKFIETLRSAA
jgi:hypothetical protein